MHFYAFLNQILIFAVSNSTKVVPPGVPPGGGGTTLPQHPAVAVPTQTGIELSEKLITQNFIEYKIGCNENIFEEIVQTLVRFKSSATLTGVKNTELHDSLFTDRRYDQGCYSKLRRFKWYLQRAIGNPLKKRSETSDLRNK